MSTVSLPGLNLSKTSSKIESIDHTWLRMGNPIMVINTIYDFEVAIDKDKIFSYLFDRISKIEKYNAIPVDGKWVAKNSLDYDYHFTFTQAVEGYQKEISNIVSTPLDESHPYWRFHLIKFSESRFSLVMRTHHGYGDGSALVGLLNYLDQNWTGKQMEMNPSRARRRGFKDIFKVSYL